MAAYCIDNAVRVFGVLIENALGETVNVGTRKEPRYEPRYTLSELLSPHFHLPAPTPPKAKSSDPNVDGFKTLMMLAQNQRSGVKKWRTIEPS